MKLLPHLPAYETQDLSPIGIVRAYVGLIASVILSFAIVGAIIIWLTPAERPVPKIDTEQLRAGPRLEVDEKQDARHLNDAALQRLQGYAWTDRKAGEAHIPIGRAIALLAKQGWPDTDDGGAKP
jgi:hypothetical protein